jgi:hypothetical protein
MLPTGGNATAAMLMPSCTLLSPRLCASMSLPPADMDMGRNVALRLGRMARTAVGDLLHHTQQGEGLRPAQVSTG